MKESCYYLELRERKIWNRIFQNRVRISNNVKRCYGPLFSITKELIGTKSNETIREQARYYHYYRSIKMGKRRFDWIDRNMQILLPL